MKTRSRTLVTATALIAGCGGGGGDAGPASQATASGIFVDSMVQGISYTCGSTVGMTDSRGTFEFVPGDVCTFKVGGITLGSVMGKSVVSPVDLVAGAADETNPAVTQMTQFLMSLDHDNDPANGIVIDQAMHDAMAGKTLDFNQPAAAFAAAAQSMMGGAMGGRMLPSAGSAQAHLRSTLMGLLSGVYRCTYDGTAVGTVTMSIANGVVTGSGLPAGATVMFGVNGTVSSGGSASLNITSGGTSNGASWSGRFSPGGTGSGTWSQPPNDGGTWNCTKG